MIIPEHQNSIPPNQTPSNSKNYWNRDEEDRDGDIDYPEYDDSATVY